MIAQLPCSLLSLKTLTIASANVLLPSLQEIAAVDRVFPALDQEEMQLACKHVLNPVTSSMGDDPMDGSGHDAHKLTPEPLPMAAAAQAGAESNGAAGGRQSNSEQPVWLQSRDELDPWMLQNLRDGDRRLKMVQALTDLASPFRYGASRVVRALGNLFSENVS